MPVHALPSHVERSTIADRADRRWAAVLSRDRTADGTFFYGVTSTGIFCKPSCPSRRPHRRRVRFFSSSSAALATGFRPCRRCQPLEATDPWARKIGKACDTIAAAETLPSLAALAAQAGTTPSHFLRRFKAALGVTPRQFASARRFAAVKRSLRSGRDVTTALFEAGYGSSSRFYEGAAPLLAMAPATYKAGARGVTIRYVTTSSSLGRMLVAATAKGVCGIAFGDSDAALVAGLRAEYPRATLMAAPRQMRSWVSRVLTLLVPGQLGTEFPLDIRATAFQWRVWSALREIPPGETRTYGQVAAAIGRPGAARAVARACASNRVAVAIPCHRVVPANVEAGVGGYRWGAARKAMLLEGERPGG